MGPCYTQSSPWVNRARIRVLATTESLCRHLASTYGMRTKRNNTTYIHKDHTECIKAQHQQRRDTESNVSNQGTDREDGDGTNNTKDQDRYQAVKEYKGMDQSISYWAWHSFAIAKYTCRADTHIANIQSKHTCRADITKLEIRSGSKR